MGVLIHEDQNNNCYPVFKDPINTWNSCRNLISPEKHRDPRAHQLEKRVEGPTEGLSGVQSSQISLVSGQREQVETEGTR